MQWGRREEQERGPNGIAYSDGRDKEGPNKKESLAQTQSVASHVMMGG